MVSENILIGNVRKCKGFTGRIGLDMAPIRPISELHEENVVLVKIGESRYVDIRNYTLLLQVTLLYLDNVSYLKTSNLLDYPYNRTMGINPDCRGDLFVEEATLRPYYNESKNVSIKELRIELGKK